VSRADTAEPEPSTAVSAAAGEALKFRLAEQGRRIMLRPLVPSW